MTQRGVEFHPRRGFILMSAGLISLMLGGLAGIFTMWTWAGWWRGPLLGVDRHWALMVFGFFGALIGNELLNVLSIEWKGRAAPNTVLIPAALLLWGAVLSTLAEFTAQALILAGAYVALLAYYSAKTYLTPSSTGLRPFVYNYLIIAALAATLFYIVFSPSLYLKAAALIFPVGTIFAVMTRDISLVTGRRPSRGYEGAAAFLLVTAGLFAWSLNAAQVGGLLIFLAAALSAATSGILRGAGRGKALSVAEILTAYMWLGLGGLLLLLTGGSGLWYDVALHAVALGFIFNIVFGVDVILLDALMSQIRKKVVVRPRRAFPVVGLASYVLLNIGLAARALYAHTGQPLLATISGPLVGLAVVAFLVNMQLKILRQ